MTDTTNTQTDQTHAADAGHTTTEHFWTKVLVICGMVIAVAGFLGDVVTQISGILPVGSTALKIAGVVGTLVSTLTSIAYMVSRTLIKLKLADATNVPPDPKSPVETDPAAVVLGSDAPEEKP